MSGNPSFEELTDCQAVLFEWADSYDAKDWDRLRKIISPHLKVDYTAFIDKEWDALPAEDFVHMVSNPHFLGNPVLRTQHFIGAGKWQKLSGDEITGTFQLRVAHQKYTDETLKEVDVKGHDHGTGQMWFKRVDGTWKFSGLKPNSRWSEFNMDQIFGH